MKITLVPSAVSEGDGTRGFFLASYLIDGSRRHRRGRAGMSGRPLGAIENPGHLHHPHVTSITSRRCRSSWKMSFRQQTIA